MSDNRRQFSRVLFQSEAVLSTPSAEIPVSVVDISLKGALVRPVAPDYIEVGSVGTLTIALSDADAQIKMETTVVHHQGDYFGLACRDIDLDSLTHLRRLVELNLGDETVLNRELNALAVRQDAAG